MLTSKQRNQLRSIGNDLDPILIIGKGGIGPSIIEQLDEALTAREILKARVLPHNEYDPGEIAKQLADQTNSEIVQVIGRNIIFYRPPQPGTLSKINL